MSVLTNPCVWICFDYINKRFVWYTLCTKTEHPTISAAAENFIIPAGSSLSQVLLCNATGGYPPVSSISWVRNGRIIIENTTGDTVVFTTGAEGAGNPFGLFLCRVNKSVAPTEEAVLIRERGTCSIHMLQTLF